MSHKYKINMTDKYTTRSGKEVEILAIDRKLHNGCSVVIEEKNEKGERWITERYSDGTFWKDKVTSDLDLVLKPKKIKGWVNVYEDEKGNQCFGYNLWPTKKKAIEIARKETFGRYLGCIKLNHTRIQIK